MAVWFIDSFALFSLFTSDDSAHLVIKRLLQPSGEQHKVHASPLADMEIMHNMREEARGGANFSEKDIGSVGRALNSQPVRIEGRHCGIGDVEMEQATNTVKEDRTNPIYALTLALYQTCVNDYGATGPTLRFVANDEKLVDLVRRKGFSAIMPSEVSLDVLEQWIAE